MKFVIDTEKTGEVLTGQMNTKETFSMKHLTSIAVGCIDMLYDIFVNCNWVVTRWQYTFIIIIIIIIIIVTLAK